MGFPCRILNINHKKELLRSRWVGWIQDKVQGSECSFQGLGVDKRVTLNPKPQTLRVTAAGEALSLFGLSGLDEKVWT